MENKRHIHAAKSLNGDYMYTVAEGGPDVMYSLFFETGGRHESISTYAPGDLKHANPGHAHFTFDEVITFNNLLREIVAQVEGKSDISQGNHFNHSSLDEEDIEDKEDGDSSPSFIMRNKRPTTKEEREAEGLPGQDAYEAGLMDGKKSCQRDAFDDNDSDYGKADKSKYLYRISLKANNENYKFQGLYGKEDHTEVVNETDNPEADELIRKFLDSMKGIGFMEETVHRAVLELADEFSSYD